MQNIIAPRTFKVIIERGKDKQNRLFVEFERKENSSAKDVHSEQLEKLNRLSEDWTSVAISFFELVPTLSEIGFFFADHGFEVHTLRQVRELAISKTTEEDDDITRETYLLPEDKAGSLIKTLSKTEQVSRTAIILSRNALSSLVAEYEMFMSRLLIILSELREEIILTPETTIPISDLSEFDSFESLKRSTISKKVEELLHSKSQLEILEWIGQKFGVNLTSDKELLKDFFEICQRRHIIIHSGGKVSRRYIRNCVAAGWKEDELPKLGQEIDFGRKYLRRATARVFQVGFFTLHILWQKLIPKNSKTSVSQILSTSHDFLENDLTKMADRVCDFCLNSKTEIDTQMRAFVIINHAQSKWFDNSLDLLERKDMRDQILNRHDWSLRNPIIDLALACLREEWEDMRSLVKKAHDDGMTYEDVFSWNIFKEAWNQNTFIEGVCESYGLRVDQITSPLQKRGLRNVLTIEDQALEIDQVDSSQDSN